MDKIKRDCFAWHEELGYCIALKETYCAKADKCNFYQNAKERCRKCSEKTASALAMKISRIETA